MPLAAQPAPAFKSKNKERRHDAYLKHKRAKESSKRDERFKRKREEDRNPRLRVERRSRNVPITLDRKRVWDEADLDTADSIGVSVDVGGSKRQKGDVTTAPGAESLTESNLKRAEVGDDAANVGSDSSEATFDTSLEDESEKGGKGEDAEADSEDDLASLMDDSFGSEDEDENGDSMSKEETSSMPPPPVPERAASPANSSASTNLSLIPDALVSKFPSLFTARAEPPKVLITTNINGTVHNEAKLLTTLFPNSRYVPRTRQRHSSYHFSVREIAKYASNRSYTALVILAEDRKRPSGMTVVNLPEGPTFHFSITNWIEGKKLPGHGNPTEHDPELILNNFRTPLGLLTASLFRTLFPPQPEIQGRQVVTLHNQRDYIFVRRHRYVFRDRRATEKAVTSSDGKSVKGAEEVRAGLQELGPRFTLKLRRVDKGIQRASGQEWEWKSRMEKQRTKFQL